MHPTSCGGGAANSVRTGYFVVRLTCYGGVGQIGGNQFLLEDGETRLLLDFGIPFSERGRFYEEYLKPRPAFGLLDPLTMGLLPPLRGLYRPDIEQGSPDAARGTHQMDRVRGGAGPPRFRSRRRQEPGGGRARECPPGSCP